jgi:hypothetical protein
MFFGGGGVVVMAKQPELNFVEFINKYGTEKKCIANFSSTSGQMALSVKSAGQKSIILLKPVAYMNANIAIIKPQ